MTVNQAVEFFTEHGQKKIVKRLLPLQDVGLGYIKLGPVSYTHLLIAFIGTRKYKANPILMIIACGIAGLLLY